MLPTDDLRSHLHPADAPNFIVWCERCQAFHREHTFTQGDYDQVIAKHVKALADAIDAAALASLPDIYPNEP